MSDYGIVVNLDGRLLSESAAASLRNVMLFIVFLVLTFLGKAGNEMLVVVPFFSSPDFVAFFLLFDF